jgi:hypothetical protein
MGTSARRTRLICPFRAHHVNGVHPAPSPFHPAPFGSAPAFSSASTAGTAFAIAA